MCNTVIDVNPLENEVLTKILLMQNMLSQLPNERALFEFVARGVSYLPGVASVDFEFGPNLQNRVGSEVTRVYRVHFNEYLFGYLHVHLAQPELFTPYQGYIGNLSFMMAAIMNQFRRNEEEREKQQELEQRVQERTRQLARQVVETQAAITRLQAETERANMYLDVSEAMILELDVYGNVKIVNRRGAELLGWPQSELQGRNWIDTVIPDKDRSMVRELYRQILDGDVEPLEYYENEILCRDGSIRYIGWHIAYRYNNQGGIYGVLSSGTDLTERKRAEIALMAEKERLAVTMRSIADGVITTDNANLVQSMNRAAEQYTGCRESDAVGRPLDEIYKLGPLTDAGSEGAYEDTCLDSGSTYCSLKTCCEDNAAPIIISQMRSPIHDHTNQRVGTAIVFRDETKQFILREQLERVARLDSIGVLAGGIAHDFNNLLSGLFGFVEMASMSDDIERIRSLLKKSTTVYERARHLTSQLLTFSKGGAPLLKTGDVTGVVHDAATFALSGANVSCSFEAQGDIWQVAFDENQLSQVIDNLVINAKQSMSHSGTIKVRVQNTLLRDGQVVTLPAGKYVQISVQDFGCGILAHDMNRIFDPFFTTRKEGNGLGLATVHSIVHKHGGALDVKSKPGEGSTFYVYLPVSMRESANAVTPHSAVHRGKGTILFLEDEAFLREIGLEMLNAMGYDVECFEDGPAVLSYIQSLKTNEKKEIVAGLFDLTIPGGTGGAEIVNAVNQALDDVVTIAVSGYSAGDVMSHPENFGFSDSLPKPFRMHELSTLLNKYL